MDCRVYRFSALRPAPNALRWLDSNELRQYRAMGNRAEKYLLARTTLKQELSVRTGVPPEKISLAYNEHGKPEWFRQPFNISHSGDCLCIAFHHEAIGVDVETMRPRPFESLAVKFMCPQQHAAFVARGCPTEEFFACWCATEALIKRQGNSIWRALEYPFLYEKDRIIPLFPQAPSIKIFAPLPGYMGAVAY